MIFSDISRHVGNHNIGFMELNLTSSFVCVEVLQPNQPDGVMFSVVSLHNHSFNGQSSPLSS